MKARAFYKKEDCENNEKYDITPFTEKWFYGKEEMIKFAESYYKHKLSEPVIPQKTSDVNLNISCDIQNFANEYTLWVISVGQKYINALSPDFTTESSMDIFINKYYNKGWMD